MNEDIDAADQQQPHKISPGDSDQELEADEEVLDYKYKVHNGHEPIPVNHHQTPINVVVPPLHLNNLIDPENSFELPGRIKSPKDSNGPPTGKSSISNNHYQINQKRVSFSPKHQSKKKNNLFDKKCSVDKSVNLHHGLPPLQMDQWVKGNRLQNNFEKLNHEVEEAQILHEYAQDNFMTKETDRKLLWNVGQNQFEEDERYIFDGASYSDWERIPTGGGIGRSKTAEIKAIAKRDQPKLEQLIEMSDLSRIDHVTTDKKKKRKLNYKDSDEMLFDDKLPEGSLINHAHQLSQTKSQSLATERLVSKNSTSTLFGSLNLNQLRSARQHEPKSFQELRKVSQNLSATRGPSQQHQPPFKQRCQQSIKRYFNSLLDGMFLRFIFCQAFSLRGYILLMASLDIILAIIDCTALFQRGISLKEASDTGKLPFILAISYFSLKIILQIPIVIFALKLFKKNGQRQGKTLYGLKLVMFFTYVLANIIGLFFMTQEGCNVFHTNLQHSSFGNNHYSVNSVQETPINQPKPKNQKNDPFDFACSIPQQITEVLGLFVYHFFSCWVILSILHWIRRGGAQSLQTEGDFVNLITQTLSLHPNPIVTNHARSRPIVHSSQLQKNKLRQINDPSPRLPTKVEDELATEECEDDDIVRLNSKQRNEQINLKVVMKTLQDFKSDSQRSRRQQKLGKTTARKILQKIATKNKQKKSKA